MIEPSIRAELDQTSEWWQGKYDALIRKRIPRTREAHDGHTIEDIESYGRGVIASHCTECGVKIDAR